MNIKNIKPNHFNFVFVMFFTSNLTRNLLNKIINPVSWFVQVFLL